MSLARLILRQGAEIGGLTQNETGMTCVELPLVELPLVERPLVERP